MLDEHQETVAEQREIRDVNRGPDDPGREATEPQAAGVHHRITSPDHGEAAGIVIAKRRRLRAPARDSRDGIRHVSSLLDRDLGDAWERAAVLLERHDVADHEDFGMTGHAEVGVDPDPAGVVRGSAQPVRDR